MVWLINYTLASSRSLFHVPLSSPLSPDEELGFTDTHVVGIMALFTTPPPSESSKVGPIGNVEMTTKTRRRKRTELFIRTFLLLPLRAA